MSKQLPFAWANRNEVSDTKSNGQSFNGRHKKYVECDMPLYAEPPATEINAELLKALKRMLVLYQGKKPGVWGESLEQVIDARAAIARAEGGAA